MKDRHRNTVVMECVQPLAAQFKFTAF